MIKEGKLLNISIILGSILTAVGIGAYINVVFGICALLICGLTTYIYLKHLHFDSKGSKAVAVFTGYLELLLFIFTFYNLINKNEYQKSGVVCLFCIGISLFFLPFVYKICEKYIHVVVNRYKRPVSSIVGNILALLNVIFIIYILLPSNLLFSNVNDITISFKIVMKSLLPNAITIFLITSLVLNILPKKVYRIINKLLFSFSIAIYVQYMFFNNHLTEIDGRSFNWKNNEISAYINILVWVVIFVLPFISISKLNKYKSKIAWFIPAALLFIQSVNFITSIVSAPKSCFENKTYRYITDSEFELAAKENIIVFIIDAVDNDYVTQICEDDPDFFNEFKDFTLYDNTCSVYDYTHTSLNQMLTGYKYGDETNYADDYYQLIKNEGYVFECYGYSSYMGFPDITEYIDNYVALSLDDSDECLIFYDRIRSDFLNMSLYQILPDICKGTIDVDSLKYNNISVKAKDDNSHYENEEFNDSLNFTINENSAKKYILYHIQGTHFPCENYIETTKYCLDIAKNMISQLEELGLYDDSTIIIMSDHGLHDQAEEYEWPTAGTPMFLIKEKNTNSDSMKISHAPIYFTDYMSTILCNMNLYNEEAKGKFGNSIYEYSEADKRERTWYDRYENEDGKYRAYTYVGNYDDLKQKVADEIYEDIDIY